VPRTDNSFFTLGVGRIGASEFRDSDNVLRILPFVVRHAQRRAHSKSAGVAGLRIPERAIVQIRKKCQAESNDAKNLADQFFPSFSFRKRDVMSMYSILCVILINSH